MERIMKMAMPMSALAQMTIKHYNLPPDSIYMKSEYDKEREMVHITFKHQTFDFVHESKLEHIVAETSSVEEPKIEPKVELAHLEVETMNPFHMTKEKKK